jgi:hypothetical protein
MKRPKAAKRLPGEFVAAAIEPCREGRVTGGDAAERSEAPGDTPFATWYGIWRDGLAGKLRLPGRF